jgi:hypothetical protein
MTADEVLRWTEKAASGLSILIATQLLFWYVVPSPAFYKDLNGTGSRRVDWDDASRLMWPDPSGGKVTCLVVRHGRATLARASGSPTGTAGETGNWPRT